ncbi:hypothetical protein SeMB42_g02128 [Synchytrium endobioticum]|uniref:ABC transporter domain-containing protein n=1 Tax=Synchytrium endobioticum TaxID=286115 RepID=A0A507DHT8_9FUNG|nr:hypothetical protein SeMB42_g02128 [Synchytrium endobioticum]
MAVGLNHAHAPVPVPEPAPAYTCIAVSAMDHHKPFNHLTNTVLSTSTPQRPLAGRHSAERQKLPKITPIVIAGSTTAFAAIPSPLDNDHVSSFIRRRSPSPTLSLFRNDVDSPAICHSPEPKEYVVRKPESPDKSQSDVVMDVATPASDAATSRNQSPVSPITLQEPTPSPVLSLYSVIDGIISTYMMPMPMPMPMPASHHEYKRAADRIARDGETKAKSKRAVRAHANGDKAVAISGFGGLMRGLSRKLTRKSTHTVDPKSGVELSWRDLNYCIPSGKKKGDVKYLLKNVNGQANVGEVLAIMGGSGAGKSTLMDVLSGRARGGTASGDIRFNNYASDADWRKSIGYVKQDDLFWEMLTVRETLMYAAQMKLSYLSKPDREGRITKIASQMRLTHVIDSRIGDTLNRGISGGERKRLSIAVALLSEPDIMMLDEPTSGLDAFNARIVIELLHTMAVENSRTVLLTIHQPRREILACFDKIMILARGEMLYYGNLRDGVDYFRENGYPVPPMTNPADHFLDMATFDSSSPANLHSSSHRIAALLQAWKSQHESFKLPPYIPIYVTTRPNLPPPQPALRSFATNTAILVLRQWRLYLRDTALIRTGLASSAIFIALYGILWFHLPVSQDGAGARTSFFFMFGLNRFFSSMFGVLLRVPSRLALVRRERESAIYNGLEGYWAMYIATYIQFQWLAFPTMVAMYFLMGLQLSARRFVIYFVAGNLLYLGGHTYGSCLGSMTSSVSGSLTYSLVLMGIFAAYSGYIIVPSDVPAPMLFLTWVNPLYLGYTIWSQNEIRDLTWTCLPTDLVCDTTGHGFLKSLSMYALSTEAAFSILCAVILGFSWVGYFLFERSTRPSYLQGILVQSTNSSKRI